MSETVLSCVGLGRRFGDVVAVRDFDLSVNEGELLCLLGPSGCGKTTALRLIAGLERPDAGTIEVGGRAVAGSATWVAPEDRRVGMVFQEWALFPHLDVAGNVSFGLDGTTDATRTEELLELVRLGGLGHRMPHELSGGQQQRVALARALAPSPRVLLLDEPFSNLDAQLRAAVRREVREVLRATGTTAVFVTHDQEEALSMADRVAVMIEGTIRRVGTPYEVYADPRDAEVARLLGQGNIVAAEFRGGVARTVLGEFPVSAPDGAGQILVQAERMRVSADPRGAAKVVQVEYYGHDQVVTCALTDGTRLDVRMMGPHPDLSVGEQVRLEVVGEPRALVG